MTVALLATLFVGVNVDDGDVFAEALLDDDVVESAEPEGSGVGDADGGFVAGSDLTAVALTFDDGDTDGDFEDAGVHVMVSETVALGVKDGEIDCELVVAAVSDKHVDALRLATALGVIVEVAVAEFVLVEEPVDDGVLVRDEMAETVAELDDVPVFDDVAEAVAVAE